jgi:hypothetical protein
MNNPKPGMNISQQVMQPSRPPIQRPAPIAQPGRAHEISAMMKWLVIGIVVFLACILMLVGVASNFTAFRRGVGSFLPVFFYWLPWIGGAIVGGWLLRIFKKEFIQIAQLIGRAILYAGPSRDLAKARVEHVKATTKHIEAKSWQIRHSLPINERFNSVVYVSDDGIPALLAGPQPELPSGIHSLTYHNAPRVTGMQQEPLAQIEAPEAALQIARPRVDQFYGAIPYNSRQTGLGIDTRTQQLVIAEIVNSTHFKFVGGSGQGKSCVAASVLDIAIHTNDCDHLQIGLLDMEHNTSRLFEDSDHVAELGPRRVRLIGRNPDEVAARIETLYQELKRRSELGEAHCLQYEPLLLVYVEELLALKFEVSSAFKKQMIERVNILGVRGRKYGIFLLACMQTDYSDKSMREGMAQFRTRGAFAIDPEVARASGFFNKELILQNFQNATPGQYVLEKPSYSGVVLAADYDVKAKLARRVATTQPTTAATTRDAKSHYATVVSEVENSGSEVAHVVDTQPPTTGALQAISQPLTAQEKRIIQKYRSGMSVSAIVASEFTNSKGDPLNGGDLFKQKAREVQQLIASLLPEVE